MAAPERIGLVISGGGARGAYEAGVLSVLLPALERRGERVSIFGGEMHAGAAPAGGFVLNARLPVDRGQR